MKEKKEIETVNAAMDKANTAIIPNVPEPKSAIQLGGTPGRIGSSKLTLRKKKVSAILQQLPPIKKSEDQPINSGRNFVHDFQPQPPQIYQ